MIPSRLRRDRRSLVGDENALEQVVIPSVAAVDQDLLISASASWVSRGVLVFCLVAGPLALAAQTWSVLAAPSAPATQTTDDSSAEERIRAGEFGVRVVAAWLGATRSDNRLEGLVGGGEEAALAPSPVPVADLQVAGVERAGANVWSVTVAGTISAAPTTESEPADLDVSAPTVRRYFRVPVVVAESGGMTSLAVPAVVPGPELVSDRVQLDYPTGVPTSSLLGAAAHEFLAALLTGSGDVTRYVSPGLAVPTDSVHTFTQVKVSTVTAAKDSNDFDPARTPRDGQTIRALVSGVGVLAVDRSVPLQYALTFTGRAGRWEVSQIDTAPKWRVTVSSADDATTSR